MKETTWTKLKVANARDIKEGPCLKITADGETVGYLIVNPQGLMRDRVEGVASLIDASKGLS